MCLAARGRANMSRISNRASTIAAALAIVLLVILLVILWTGVRAADGIESGVDVDARRGRNATGVDARAPRVFVGVEDSRTEDGFSTATDTDAEENFTNEVLPKEEKVTRQDKSTLDLLPSKGDFEHVWPMKISQNLYEDPPEASSTAKRHHSGHFRHVTAEVWDPHPQYEFTAFGKRFRLQLSHDTNFVSPNIKVIHMSENTTRREHPGRVLGCFYSGTVDGDPRSAVMVNLCHGMTGHVRTSTGSYYIKPTEQWHENDKDSLESSLQHAIHRVPTPASSSNHLDNSNDQSRTRNCGVIDYDTNDTPVLLTDDNSDEQIYVGRSRERRSLGQETTSIGDTRRNGKYEEFVGHGERNRNFLRNNNRDERYYSVESDPFVTWRPRRALPREYFIEIMVVADAKMVKYHGEGLTSYILDLMNTVSRLYKDPSIGNPISIVVTKIQQTDAIFGVRHRRSDGIAASEMLKRFCYWQKSNNPDEPSPDHHDAALLLTRENLCHNPDQMRCDTLGLAELGRMCSPGSSCAIVQDNGLAAAFTIAHEIGHVLNMPHDDDTKCTSFRNRSAVSNVMSRMLDDNTFPWEWSKCSRHYVTEFLEAGYGDCLLDEPSKTMQQDDAGRLSGENYSENKQCEFVFGPGSRICPQMVSDVCRTLWCTAPKLDNYQQCHTQHMPWADGSSCGVDKWCNRGECVSRKNLPPVHGQWGEWGPYGECSRTCGGGIMESYRECNNPSPLNNGNYCVGARVRYSSCATEECPPGTPDFREQQCSQFDNNNLNIQDLARDVKWHAKYTRILPRDRCKLFCQVESNQYYMLRSKVIDGTPCGLDTFDVCVNGHCRPAGCDHDLNSTAKLDTCGVCNGDNSTCQRITGSYNSSVNGYTRVARIPAGSSNIDIRQRGWMDMSYDTNYLALRLGEGGEYILNGKFVVMHQKVIIHPAFTIDYSGPESVVERLNSSRPIDTDLILEILSVETVYPPQITYEYTVPKKILKSYTWILSDWSDCSRKCQGTKYRKAECRSIEHKDVVSDDYCREAEKPSEESQICNAHCILQWQVTPVSECSSHCGPGTRSVVSRCVQIRLNSDHPPQAISNRACAYFERPSDQEPCVGPCKNAHWNYGQWGQCSATCGGGIQFRTAICVDSNGRPVAEDACFGQEKHLKKICGQDSCPKWAYGEWNPCTVSCGVGKRHRLYWCRVDNKIVRNSYCNGPPTGVTEVCDAGPCHKRHPGDWSSVNGSQISYSADPSHDDPSQQDNEIDNNPKSRSGYEWQIESYRECSKPCIDGFTRRSVTCTSNETGIIAPDHYCEMWKKPATMVNCERHRCPKWNTGDWSQCDGDCGIRYQHRQVRCESPRGEILPDEDCLDSEKPDITKQCPKRPCATTPRGDRVGRLETNISRRWRMSNWTACSKSCGSGIQRRRVECMMRRGNYGPEVPVKDEQCSKLGLSKPRSLKMCRRVACNYIWQEGAWSECSAECGDGIQHRTATCHRVDRYGSIESTPSEGCPIDQRPVTTQSCKLRDCNDKFYWSYGPWKQCSHVCGRKGRQTRRLFCHDKTGRKVARTRCPAEFKPHRKQKCNQRKCGPVSCRDVQRRFKTTKDDEYILIVGGRNMSIYCHGMATNEPKEYLTLPSGSHENYAEVYDKRLSNLNSCPYNGQRNDSCDCVTVMEGASGKTMFGRVRIDPIRLHIVDNDYTFSRTEGKKRIEYGRAGDCYSSADCPQGSFRINLSGTRFKLSSDVFWGTRTPGTSMKLSKINDQHIVGKCGGSCGFCKPRTELKLDVLPP